jgi:hypothetical protein
MNNIRNHVVFGKNICTWSLQETWGRWLLNIIQGQGVRIIRSFLLTAILVPPIGQDADRPPCPFSFCK